MKHLKSAPHLLKILFLGCFSISAMGCYHFSESSLKTKNESYFHSSHLQKQALKKTKGIYSRPLTLKTILAHLLRHSLNARVLELESRALAAEGKGPSLFENPELRVTSLSSGIRDKDRGGLELRLRWKPPFPGEHRAQKAEAHSLAKAESRLVDLKLLELIAKIRLLFAQNLVFYHQGKILTKLLSAKKRLLKHRQEQVNMGLASQMESDACRLNYIKTTLLLSENNLERKKLRFQLFSLAELETKNRLSRSSLNFSLLPQPERIHKLLSKALRRHPTLKASKEVIRARHARQWLAKTQRIPWFDFVQFGYDFGPDDLPARFQLGLSLRLPILDFGNNDIQRAQANLKTAKIRRLATEKRIISQVRACRAQVVATRQALVSFNKQNRGKIREILARAQKADTSYGADPVEILKVQSLAYGLELARLKLVKKYFEAVIELDLATARPVWQDQGIRIVKPNR